MIHIYLPPGYNPDGSINYDVMYVLDGESNTSFVSHVQQYGIQEKLMPPFIIVGIINTHRTRDLTPTPSENSGSGGGAANFLSFLKNELIPHIKKTYFSRGENILFGQSYGGLFAMNAMLSEPTLFSCAIIAEPSFWWGGTYTSSLAIEKLHTLSGMNKIIYMAGIEENMEGMGIWRMDSILESKAPIDMLHKAVVYPDESHSSMKLKCVYDGLRFIYGGYRERNIKLEFHPTNGIVLRDKPYSVYKVSPHPNIRFTTDGTEPTASSDIPKFENVFIGPLRLNMKSFSLGGRYNKSAKGEFVVGESLSPLKNPANLQSGGLSYSYYEGQRTDLPDFRKLKPLATGLAGKDFDTNKLPSRTNFACLFQGAIEIKQEGYYTFFLFSDEDSKLYVGNKLLVANEGPRAQRTSKSYMVPLTTGLYPIRIEYFHKDGAADLRLKCILPGKKEPEALHFDAQFHDSSLMFMK